LSAHPEASPDPLLPTRAVAELLGVGPDRLLQLVRLKKFPPPSVRRGVKCYWLRSVALKTAALETEAALAGAGSGDGDAA
jgi:hypothetical protein